MSPASGTSDRPRTTADVADAQGAGLDQGGRNRAAIAVHASLDDRADRGALGVGLEVLEVGHEEDHVDEVVEAEATLRGDGHERRVAAVLLDDDAGLGQLGLDPIRIGIRLVHLVEGDDDRHLGRLGVADRLERLGHDPVVGRDHDDGDVGDLGPPGAHGREGLVARRVEEDDPTAVLRDLAGADVLGDAAALAGRHGRRPDGIEEAGLAVVDVAHDGHDRSPRDEVGRVVLGEELLLGCLGGSALLAFIAGLAADRGLGLGDLVAELRRHEGGRIPVDELVDGREDAALDQLPDDVCRVDPEELGKLLDGDGRGQLDGAALARIRRLDARRCERAVAARWLAGAAPAAGAAPTPGHGLLLGLSVR
jgi:hypothetical protein